MTMFERLKVFTVKVRRAYWQWMAGFVTKAKFDHSTDKKCAFGVTLSGGEFTPGGEYGQNYGYPIRESIDYYASVGMKFIRLPFLWERVQPSMYKPLDDFHMSKIDEVVNYAISKGMEVGIDVHNGGYRDGHVIGSKSVPNAAFDDLWFRLATHFGNNPKIIWMLMSEPSDQCARQWIKTANSAIQAIRKTGAEQTIVVPGTYFDGGWTWCVSDNAKRVGQGVIDPKNNYMFEIHQYMDHDAAGGTPGIVSPTIGADRLADVTQWARHRGKKLFLGEFAAARDDVSLAALAVMMRFVTDNADVWKYAAWWGGGDRWYPDNMFRLDPLDYSNPTDQPQMTVLKRFM